jgi:hypothetical protein
MGIETLEAWKIDSLIKESMEALEARRQLCMKQKKQLWSFFSAGNEWEQTLKDSVRNSLTLWEHRYNIVLCAMEKLKALNEKPYVVRCWALPHDVERFATATEATNKLDTLQRLNPQNRYEVISLTNRGVCIECGKETSVRNKWEPLVYCSQNCFELYQMSTVPHDQEPTKGGAE